MNKFLGIVESTTPPPIQYMWVYKGEIKYFSNGKWVSTKDRVSVDNSEGEAIVHTPVIKLGNSTEDKNNNIQVCSNLSTTEVISISIEGTMYGITYDAIGIYHNGTISILEGNHCTVFDINFNTGEVTLDSKYDTSKFLPYIDLEIGDSELVKTRNIEKLRTGTFFCSINYGYGVGNWNPTTGGQATVITSFNHAVHYIIMNDGTITKEAESPDLYFEYVNNGGKKSGEEFALALAQLIE